MFLPKIIILLQVGIFGLILGSFLNVCIYRIPQKLSLMGRSYCPNCKSPIPMYRNIPVLTYLFQFGKSACCKTPISLQYPSVELLTGVFSVLTYLAFPRLDLYFIWFLLFVTPLIVISGIDFKLRLIPDVISLPFIVIGIGTQIYLHYPEIFTALKFSFLGIFIGGGSLLLIAEIFSRLKGVEAMGGGDIKLAAMLGAFLGWKSLIFIFFVSSFLAVLYFAIQFLFKGKETDTTLPFGPFLSMAGIIYLLYGKWMTDWYFQMGGFTHNPFFD